MTVKPSRVSSAAAGSIWAEFRDAMATFAPDLAREVAIALPIPVPPPVTIAVLPFSMNLDRVEQ
jgi:hypothetical protein